MNMLESKDLFALAYYELASFTGSLRGFRFRIEKDVSGDEENKIKQLKLTFYPDKVEYNLTPDEEKESMLFPFSDEGLEQIKNTINER